MDFDFGNLIYILLTLVFVIFGAMNKKKKPVQKPQEVMDEDMELDQEIEQPVSSFNDNFKKLFGDFSDMDTVTQVTEDSYVEEYEEQENESLSDSSYSTLDVVEEEVINPVYRMSDHMDSIRTENAKSIAFKENFKPSFTQMLYKEFDPKKALLYSEIFKPKYF